MSAAEGEAGVELKRLETERSATAAGVDEALLATYERMRPRMDGIAVAHISNGTCTGCHLSLSAADLDHLARLKPGEYATCEQCGRILIPS